MDLDLETEIELPPINLTSPSYSYGDNNLRWIQPQKVQHKYGSADGARDGVDPQKMDLNLVLIW